MEMCTRGNAPSSSIVTDEGKKRAGRDSDAGPMDMNGSDFRCSFLFSIAMYACAVSLLIAREWSMGLLKITKTFGIV